ncbi:MAG: phage tail protein [Candidatus Zixiibacteriota bacterium]
MTLQQDIQNALTIALPELQVARFAVVIDGESSPLRAGFRECHGLGGTLSPFTINEPGDDKQRNFPQRVIYKPVTLVKGLDVDGFLYRWWKEAKEWEPGRADYHRTVTIYSLQEIAAHVAIARRGWDLFGAYVSEWSGPEHNAMSSDLAFERVTIEYEEMEEAPLGAFIGIG